MGVDIDQFDVGSGYGILPNSSSVTLEFGTTADKYFPGLFTFTIKMKDPTISLDNDVSDANNNHLADLNEVLTYTLTGGNNGPGNANSVVITDTLPSTVTYVPNSLQVISAPGITPGIQSDVAGDDIAEYISNGLYKSIRFRIGTGATSTSGGTLTPNETYKVQFKVKVNSPGTGKQVPSILNIARIKAQSDANVSFVDDGTSIISPNNEPDNGPLPVTMVYFTAKLLKDQKVKLDWSTSMEINCNKYIIERSFDGNIFNEIGIVAGSGTTSVFHSYTFLDDVSDALGSIVYYRLEQTDLDGKSSSSKVLSINLKNDKGQVSVSPNPFSTFINMNIDWDKNEMIACWIINSQGSKVISRNIQLTAGHNYISIDGLSKLSSGNYFIQFISRYRNVYSKSYQTINLYL